MIWLLSIKKYAVFISKMDIKAYRTRKVLPAGLYLLDLVKYRFATSYDRKLLSALAEIYGAREAAHYLRVHWAEKIIITIAALAIGGFVGIVSRQDGGYAVFCIAFAAGLAYFTDRELFEKVKKRRMELKRDFPDFVNKLALLVNAGMLVTKAWEKAAAEGKQDSPLYRELRLSVLDIKSGSTEYKAYEDFAKRCRIPEISRFVSLILQNIRKGNSELVPIMRLYANECWEMRKNLARKYGEEASTRLILPMMLMFVAILLIVGTPAVLALRGI